jgi:hypothetical protein
MRHPSTFARLRRYGRYVPTSRIFKIEVDGKLTVVFEASSWSEAKELSREEWFRAAPNCDRSYMLAAPQTTVISI